MELKRLRLEIVIDSSVEREAFRGLREWMEAQDFGIKDVRLSMHDIETYEEYTKLNWEESSMDAKTKLRFGIERL